MMKALAMTQPDRDEREYDSRTQMPTLLDVVAIWVVVMILFITMMLVGQPEPLTEPLRPSTPAQVQHIDPSTSSSTNRSFERWPDDDF